jgi:hypothetical protein
MEPALSSISVQALRTSPPMTFMIQTSESSRAIFTTKHLPKALLLVQSVRIPTKLTGLLFVVVPLKPQTMGLELMRPLPRFTNTARIIKVRLYVAIIVF